MSYSPIEMLEREMHDRLEAGRKDALELLDTIATLRAQLAAANGRVEAVREQAFRDGFQTGEGYGPDEDEAWQHYQQSTKETSA